MSHCHEVKAAEFKQNNCLSLSNWLGEQTCGVFLLKKKFVSIQHFSLKCWGLTSLLNEWRMSNTSAEMLLLESG